MYVFFINFSTRIKTSTRRLTKSVMVVVPRYQTFPDTKTAGKKDCVTNGLKEVVKTLHARKQCCQQLSRSSHRVHVGGYPIPLTL